MAFTGRGKETPEDFFMTIKELAEVAGTSPETIRRTGKEMFPEKFQNGKKTVLNKDQAILLMQKIRKKNFVNPTQNVELPTQSVEVESKLTKKDLELISSLTAGIVSKVIENLDIRMSSIESKIKDRKELLPPPEISMRDQVRKIVNGYCGRRKRDFQEAYSELYREFYYR